MQNKLNALAQISTRLSGGSGRLIRHEGPCCDDIQIIEKRDVSILIVGLNGEYLDTRYEDALC